MICFCKLSFACKDRCILHARVLILINTPPKEELSICSYHTSIERPKWTKLPHFYVWGISEWMSCYCLTPIEQFFSAISWREQITFWWNENDVRLVLDHNAELDFHSTSSLKQHSAARHVASLGYIILIPSQLVFAITP